MNNDLKILFDNLQERPIAFHRIYAKLTGSITAGLLLSQICYWDKVTDNEEFYKTDKEFCEETGLGLYELRAAKSKLVELKLITIERKGQPAKSHYKLDKELLISQISSYGKNQQLELGKTNNKTMEKPNTIYTETTPKITSENILLRNTEKSVREYGNVYINSLLNIVKDNFSLPILDGTMAENRRYSHLLLTKMCKQDQSDKHKQEALKFINSACEVAAKDEFWKNKITSIKTLYYNLVKILNLTKNNNKNNVGIIGE